MSQNASVKHPSTMVRRLKWTAALAVLGGALYGTGLWTGMKSVNAARDELTQARADLRGARAANSVLQARLFLYRASVDLESRNFGTANDNLKQAAHQLEVADFAPGDSRKASITPIAANIAKLNVEVAGDVATQRQAVLDLAKRLDAIAP